MILFQQACSEKCLAVVGGDNDSAFFCPGKLAAVHSSRCFNDTDKVTYFACV